MNSLNWSSTSEEKLQQILDSIHDELNRRATASFEEAKTKAVISIRELLAVCRKSNIYRLGSIYWVCDDCGESNYFDILDDDVLEDVANVLEGKCEK
jgi:hypothetical protein